MGSKDRNKKAAREESKASEQVADTGTKGLEETEESKTQPPGSILSFQWRRVDELKPHPLNAKIYGDHCPEDLIKSVAASAILVPLIVTPENILISGHRRCSAAKLAGLQQVPVIERVTADDEELRLLLLECNTGRHKTTEQLIREYREIKRIEESLAAKRGGARTDLRVDSPGGYGRARDLAAARVGHLSATTLELGDKILTVLDEKAESGNMQNVEEVRTILNERGVSGAEKKLSGLGWMKPKTGKSKAASDPKPALKAAKTGGGSQSVLQDPEIPGRKPVPASKIQPPEGTPDLFEGKSDNPESGGHEVFLDLFHTFYRNLLGGTPTPAHEICVNHAVRVFAEQVLALAVKPDVH